MCFLKNSPESFTNTKVGLPACFPTEVDRAAALTSTSLETSFKDLNIFVVQLLSLVQLFVTPWTAAHQAPVSSTVS